MTPLSNVLSEDHRDPDELFARARAGDEDAWDELFRKCYPKVIRVVRRQLDRPMRSLFDSTDFASDVMKSLAAKADRLDFPSFSSLIAFLTKVAKEKVIDEYRKAHAEKRDINRDCALFPDDGEGGRTLALASDEPTPSQVFVASEAQARLLDGKSEPERAVIEMKTQGYSPAEIAAQTGWHLRKVQRLFKKLHESYFRSQHA
jgi:RNA polymerase sigma factor (sigma-70 family)